MAGVNLNAASDAVKRQLAAEEEKAFIRAAARAGAAGVGSGSEAMKKVIGVTPTPSPAYSFKPGDKSWVGDPVKSAALREEDYQRMYNKLKGEFGRGNADMNRLIMQREALAYGPDKQTALARQAGNEEINRAVQTAMRQFATTLPQSGVAGGAAGAMGGILARQAVDQTRGLNRDLSINEMERRRQALGELEKTLTGERSGLVGGAFAGMGLGAQDRWGGLGYQFNEEMLRKASEAVNPSQTLSTGPVITNSNVVEEGLKSIGAKRPGGAWYRSPSSIVNAVGNVVLKPKKTKEEVMSWFGG